MTDKLEHSVTAVKSTGLTVGGSFLAVFSGMTLSDIGVVVGLLTALIGLICQICIQWRKDRREKDLMAMQRELLMAQIRSYDRRRPNAPPYYGSERRIATPDRRGITP